MRLKTASVAAAVLGAFGTTLVLQGALAADLGPPLAPPPPRAQAVYTPPPPVRNCTGFYVGGFAGGAFPAQNVTATDLDGFNGGFQHSWNYGRTSELPPTFGFDKSTFIWPSFSAV